MSNRPTRGPSPERIAQESEDWINLPGRTLRALEKVDAMAPALRECVHDFGYQIVASFLEIGVSDPNKIRMVVHSVWCGARSATANQRTVHGGKGQHSAVLAQIDWLLIQMQAPISAATLVRLLWRSGMVIIPAEPSKLMVEASIAATATMGLVSKYEKHKGRLHAAIKAAASRLWPIDA